MRGLRVKVKVMSSATKFSARLVIYARVELPKDEKSCNHPNIGKISVMCSMETIAKTVFLS
jgi:hypothetical protein